MFQLCRIRNDVVYVEGIDVNRCLPTAGDNASLLIYVPETTVGRNAVFAWYP